MGNLPPLLDPICRFRTGRGLSDQRALVLVALDAISPVIWYSMLQILPAEGGAEGRCRWRVASAGLVDRRTVG